MFFRAAREASAMEVNVMETDEGERYAQVCFVKNNPFKSDGYIVVSCMTVYRVELIDLIKTLQKAVDMIDGTYSEKEES